MPSELLSDRYYETLVHAKRYEHELPHLARSTRHANENESIANLSIIINDDESFVKSLNGTPQNIVLRTIQECNSLHAAGIPHEVAIDALDSAFSRQQFDSESDRLVMVLVENGAK